jgi:hypothetical protein
MRYYGRFHFCEFFVEKASCNVNHPNGQKGHPTTTLHANRSFFEVLGSSSISGVYYSSLMHDGQSGRHIWTATIPNRWGRPGGDAKHSHMARLARIISLFWYLCVSKRIFSLESSRLVWKVGCGNDIRTTAPLSCQGNERV